MALPPPTYEPLSQRTQLLISPCPDAVQFQKGFLGVHGERAAIEGELHIKGAEDGQWESATVSLQTVESTPQQSIELFSSMVVLFSTSQAHSSSSLSSSNAIPPSLPFSIPLMPDTPQCIHTPHSSITHRLIATLHPYDRAAQPLTKSILVHTKRYISPNRPLPQTRPRTLRIEDPVQIEVEVPRTTFRIGESIPVYVTIPPPRPSVVTANGLMLRNVMVELVRIISFGGSTLDPSTPETLENIEASASDGSFVPISPDEKVSLAPPSHNMPSETSPTDGMYTVLTRSGSSCRFHTSRAVQIRLLLYPHQSALHTTDAESRSSDQPEDDISDCASITQSTLLHRVTFYLAVKTTFLHPRAHSETVTTLDIPLVLLPNPAPLPEVDEFVAAEYRKKHDKPPLRTVRHQDADILENEAGPSAVPQGGAPPPFEERDPPPPFFSPSPQPSTSSHLPTFLESESEHISFPIEQPSEAVSLNSRLFVRIPGEGTEFGFAPSDQYDGISFSLDHGSTPPPTMANADLDANVTEFSNLVQPERALETLSLTLDQSASGRDTGPHSNHVLHLPPPPPPPLDDPSDPPPSIDVEEFRRLPLPLSREQSPPLSSLTPCANQDMSGQSMPQRVSMAHAPPPYLHAGDGVNEPEETVTRPPPYVDVLPGDDAPR